MTNHVLFLFGGNVGATCQLTHPWLWGMSRSRSCRAELRSSLAVPSRGRAFALALASLEQADPAARATRRP